MPTDVAGFVGSTARLAGATAIPAGGDLDVEPGALRSAVQAFFRNGGRKLYLAATLDDLAGIDEISLVAAPGAAELPLEGLVAAVTALIAHVDARPYRMAVVDTPLGASPSDVADFRRRFDSSRAALYHPWLTTSDSSESVPPSGAVAGLLARTAAHLPPFGELEGVTGLAEEIGDTDSEALNRVGVNLLRSSPGGGVRAGSGRTMTTGDEWKYVNVRRYIAFLEHSIDQGTQWTVFEPNGDALWAGVRDLVAEFLHAQWCDGTFPGKPEEAYFVRCDRTTMTQDDVDNGRLVCLVGVAPTRPAEFVILRIGQWTADRRYS